jgi:hypothetical protein
MYIQDTDLIKFPLLVPNIGKIDFSCLNHVVRSGPCNILVIIVDAMFGLKWAKLESRLCANIDLFAVLKCDYSQSQ